MTRRVVAILAALMLLTVPDTGFAAPAGALDPTFGKDGKVVSRVSKHGGGIEALAARAGGGLVAAGTRVTFAGTNSTPGSTQGIVVAYRENGRRAVRFGRRGTAPTPFDQVSDVAIQPDGRVVVAGVDGYLGGLDGDTLYGSFGVMRLLPNGRRDRSFGGGDGIVTSDLGGDLDVPRTVIVQPDGRVLVVGTTGCWDGPCERGIAMVRYMPAGGLDPTFGQQGKVRVVEPDGDLRWAGATADLQSSGRIVVGGILIDQGAGANDFAVRRFEQDGDSDLGFGDAGRSVIDLGGDTESLTGVAVTADDRIVITGYSRPRAAARFNFALAGLSADGATDSAFGGDGTVSTDGGQYDYAWDLVTQDTDIVVSGESRGPHQQSFALLRYSEAGELDSGFGNRGFVRTRFRRGAASARAVTVDAKGRIVAGGVAGRDFALARYGG